jgi:hypothetical protein
VIEVRVHGGRCYAFTARSPSKNQPENHMSRRRSRHSRQGVRRRRAAAFSAGLSVCLALGVVSCSAGSDVNAASTGPRPGKAPATSVPQADDSGDGATGPGGEPINVARDLPELPTDWPADVAVPQEATAITVTSFGADAPTPGRSATYAADRPVADLAAFHTAQLVAEGWTVEAEVPTTDGVAISASKSDGPGTRTLFVTIAARDGGADVVIAVTG